MNVAGCRQGVPDVEKTGLCKQQAMENQRQQHGFFMLAAGAGASDRGGITVPGGNAFGAALPR